MLQNMFIKNMLIVPSTICTSLRKGQPNVSVKQEQGVNVEASRLCVASVQSEATTGLLWQSLSYVEQVVQTS